MSNYAWFPRPNHYNLRTISIGDMVGTKRLVSHHLFYIIKMRPLTRPCYVVF
jgi:hypothetical protein